MQILIGVGNDLLADDGVGCLVSDLISDPSWMRYNAGIMPENFTKPVRDASPELVVFVDAAEMGLIPGSMRIIPANRFVDAGLGTHAMPLSRCIGLLSPYCSELVCIGIQPGCLEPDQPISQSVISAAHELVKMLEDGSWRSLTVIRGDE